MSTEKLLTIKEAANCLGLNPMTVRRWLTTTSPKRFPNARKIIGAGNVETWFIPQSDLDSFKESTESLGRRSNNPAEGFERYMSLEIKVAALEAVANERLEWIESLEKQLKSRGEELRAVLQINMELVMRIGRQAEVQN